MTEEVRILVVKLADRLHNMRTLGAMAPAKQARIAAETLLVFAPLARLLGLYSVKEELEELGFRYADPAAHASTRALLDAVASAAAPGLALARRALEQALRGDPYLSARAGSISVSPVVKSAYWVHRKAQQRGLKLETVADVAALRPAALRVVITPRAVSVAANGGGGGGGSGGNGSSSSGSYSANDNDSGGAALCYHAMGVVHAAWAPLPGGVKDYISTPKSNGYQSLHTTVIGPGGKPLEVQVRSQEMHARAEFGIAAHWSYKDQATDSRSELAWLQRIAETDSEISDPIQFLEALKLDLEQDEVYVFTPKGRVIALPARSTPVDFAYAIHTEVGHRCIGGKVNGRLVPLDTRLNSADTVEILTSKASAAGPSRDWMGFVSSTRARNKIRQWFSRERREDAIEQGRDEVARELRRASIPVAATLSSEALLAVAESMNLADLESLFAAIGDGQASAQSVVQRLGREMRGGAVDQLPTTAMRSSRTPRAADGRTAGIYVEGLDDMMVHLARCCTPVPGDQIMGFVTQGRGVSVHRTDCSNGVALTQRSRERLIDVEWDASGEGVYRATIEVHAFDRGHLLADVSQVVSEPHLNIVAARTATTADRVSRMTFDIELGEPGLLESLLNSLKQLDGVFEAFRQLPGARG